MRSAKQIKESPDFAKLAKEIELVKSRKDRKSLPLSEKELREQFSKEEVEKLDKKDEPETPKDEGGVFKFKRDFTNKEILQIMEDYIQGKKLVAELRKQ